MRQLAEERQRFDAVVAIATRAYLGFDGAEAPNVAGGVAQILFEKAVFHARSLGRVLPALSEPVTQDLDLSSAAVLTRAIAETYLAYWYSCREPKDQQDFAFRESLMSYHRLKRLEKTRDLWAWDGDADSAITESLAKAKARLEADPLFQKQPTTVKKKQLDGAEFAHRTLSDIAQSAHISPWLWRSAYAYLSQFNHAAPMAVHELWRLSPGHASAPQAIAFVLQLAGAFLSQFVFDIHNNYFRGQGMKMGVQEIAVIGSQMMLLSSTARPRS